MRIVSCVWTDIRKDKVNLNLRNGRMPLMPFRRLFVCMGQLQDDSFTPTRSANLQANRETCAGEPTGNGYSRQPVRIEWRRVARQRLFQGDRRIRVGRHFGDYQRRDLSRRRNQDVNHLEYFGDLAAYLIQLTSRLNVGHCADVSTGLDSRQSVRLVERRGFRDEVGMVGIRLGRSDRHSNLICYRGVHLNVAGTAAGELL